MKWDVTGYAMQTIAGTEKNFDLKCSEGSTRFRDKDSWTSCVDSSSLETIYTQIVSVIERATQMGCFSSLDDSTIISLVIASNFFENKFWEEKKDKFDNIDSYNYIKERLCKEYVINGGAFQVSTACSSGGSAIITAGQLIDEHISDVVIVLGYDYKSCIPCYGMSRIGAVTNKRIAPFSKGRSGTELADGIGAIILEDSEHANRRKVKVWATIVGYGSYCDAYSVTSPEPKGISLENAIRKSLSMGNVTYDKIDYINAHGSGTKMNDKLETAVFNRIFKEHVKDMYVNSSKSIVGHTLGAAGIIELIITLLEMRCSIIHRTVNFIENDESCDLNYCFHMPIETLIHYAISISIGFGGINVCILLKNRG